MSMSAVTSLNNLSIESAEVDFNERVDSEAGFRDQIANPIFAKEYEDAELVFSTFKRVNERGYVCRGDIEPVSHLADQYPAIKRMLTRYPINSFTEEPSRVNFEVSNESIVRSVLTALKEAFFRIIKFLRESLTRVWDNLTSGRKRTVEVDKIGPRVTAMQKYVLEVDLLMMDSQVKEDYLPWQRRNIKSAADNLSKNWNSLKNNVTTNQAKSKELVGVFVDTLILRTVPMAIMIEEFLTDLGGAKTPGDIGAAVAKAQMFNMTTQTMAALANQVGWKANGPRDPRLTPFKSMVSFISGSFRSQSNNRVDLSSAQLTAIMAELKIEGWGDLVPSDLTDARKRLEGSLRKLQDYDVDKNLDPGLEMHYTSIVIPFINQVSVNVSALNDLQALASMIITTRDSAMLDIANACLGVVKGMDSFISKNRDKLPPATMLAVTRYKAAVTQSL
jgi:hypothetical protein